MGVRGTPLARVSSKPPFSVFGDQVSPHVYTMSGGYLKTDRYEKGARRQKAQWLQHIAGHTPWQLSIFRYHPKPPFRKNL